MSIKLAAFCAIAAFGLSACSSYNPLDDEKLRRPIGQGPPSPSAVKVTFFGTSTLLIRDDQTSLLVDGFFSRPGPLQSLFGTIGPDGDELNKLRIGSPDAILVGHSHHDHALDSTELAHRFKTKVIGSKSFAHIYRGSRKPGHRGKLVTVGKHGRSFKIGKFRVRFVPSRHVPSFNFVQRMIEGCITEPLRLPAHLTKFDCGDVFALHISHEQGKIAITTTAAAKRGMFRAPKYKADVVFLSTGFLSKDTLEAQENYWCDTVEATGAEVIVPVHWDNFSRKLSKRLKPSSLTLIDRAEPAMEFIKGKAGKRPVRVLNSGERLWLSGGQVYCPSPTSNGVP